MIGSAGSAEKVAWLRGARLRRGVRLPRDRHARGAAGRHRRLLRQRRRRDARGGALGVCACTAASSPAARSRSTTRPSRRRARATSSYVVTKRLRIEGFIVSDHFDRFPAFLAEVGPWVRDGRVRYRETVVEGIENAPGRVHRPAGGREHREDARQGRAGRVSWRCRVFGHKVPKARWFFLTERFQRCERCGERVQSSAEVEADALTGVEASSAAQRARRTRAARPGLPRPPAPRASRRRCRR